MSGSTSCSCSRCCSIRAASGAGAASSSCIQPGTRTGSRRAVATPPCCATARRSHPRRSRSCSEPTPFRARPSVLCESATSDARLELDAQHPSALARTADLGEPRRLEDAPTADVDLVPGDLRARLRDDRVCLERACTTRSRMLDRRLCEGVGDALSPETGAHEDAGHGPDAFVFLVFVAPFPRRPVHAEERRIRRSRLDGAPADGLAVEIGDEAACRLRLRVAAVGLLPQAEGAFLRGKLRERLLRLQLVTLALTVGRRPACAEDRLKILEARLVRREDREARSHASARSRAARSAGSPCV